MPITYHTGPVKHAPIHPYGHGADGYGLKIARPYKVLHGNRWYRVYATCISNAASHWITVMGEKIHVTFMREDVR